jgi:hypothetical protein
MVFRLAFFAMLVIAALLALYFFTRKKWDWNSYAGSLAITFSALMIIPLGMFAWVSYENRLQTISELADIQLGSIAADVKFLKGEPMFQLERGENKTHWRFQDKLNPGNMIDVVFQNDKVVEISFVGPCEYCNKVNGFGIGSSHEHILKRMGETSDKEISENQLEHRLNYPEYQSFFVLKEGKVIRQGIYQP